jgi:hypothetical protein
MTRAKRVLLGRQVLDHQIIDRNGRLAGNVDDLELVVPDRGRDKRPVVAAILSGRGALADRMGGPIGRLASTLSQRLVPGKRTSSRIPLGDVAELSEVVKVDADAADLATFAVERALRDTVIDRIPGSKGNADATE